MNNCPNLLPLGILLMISLGLNAVQFVVSYFLLGKLTEPRRLKPHECGHQWPPPPDDPAAPWACTRCGQSCSGVP